MRPRLLPGTLCGPTYWSVILVTLIIFLAIVAVLVLGPQKAAELAAEAGRWKRRLEASKNEILSTLQQQVNERSEAEKAPNQPTAGPRVFSDLAPQINADAGSSPQADVKSDLPSGEETKIAAYAPFLGGPLASQSVAE